MYIVYIAFGVFIFSNEMCCCLTGLFQCPMSQDPTFSVHVKVAGDWSGDLVTIRARFSTEYYLFCSVNYWDSRGGGNHKFLKS